MKKYLLFATIGILCLASNGFAQPNIFSPRDAATVYDPAHPPVMPPANTMAKWVRSISTGWNTDKFKPYIFNNMAFRLRYPNNYDSTDATKKYPIIVFFHGGGEIGPVTDNDYHLILGAPLFEQKIDAGEFNGFMLFPQLKSGETWAFPTFQKVNNILDSIQKYCQMDPDRQIVMGLSNGAFGAVSYSADFAQRSAVAIASSPALIQLISDRQPALLHIPLWLASGGEDINPDTANMRIFVDAFRQKGGNVRYNMFPEEGHNTWNLHWALPYLVPYWQAAHKANPLLFYGRNKFSSAAAINAKLGISAGFNEYQWQKDNVDIPGATSNEYSPTQFGTYRVRFRRFSDSPQWSDWSPNPVSIILDNTVPSAPTNLKAVYNGKGFIHLDWDNSTDNQEVTGYEVFVNGQKKYTTGESAITADTLNFNSPYTFTVRAFDMAGNTSGFSNSLLASTSSTPANGLKYRLYQGLWESLPNFNALTPVATGSTPNVDISVRTPGLNDFFGFVWEGYINIPVAGTYTFETVSDDGSKLYFNSFYSPNGKSLINNDDVHAPLTRTATVNITTPGLYPFAATFFEKWSGEVMQVYWTTPNTPRQLIPNSAFVEVPVDNTPPAAPLNLKVLYTGKTHVNLDWDNATDNIGVAGYDVYVNDVKKYSTKESAITADGLNPNTPYSFKVVALDLANNPSVPSSAVGTNTTTAPTGLNYRYYEGDWDVLPNFNDLTPVKSGASANLDISVRTPNRNDYFGFVWEGYIKIPTAGTYTFELNSDDGSKFYFNSFYKPGAVPLINSDGLHAPWPVAGTVTVDAPGLYPVAITFFEKNSGQLMELYWTGPTTSRQLVPDVAFTDPSSDIVAPSMPLNLKVVYSGKSFVNLDWDNSTDNVGVTKYDVYVNGTKKYTTGESSITADKLAAGSTFSFSVKALDNAGNNSAESASVSGATTTVANGLKYRYYEGSWDALPNFNSLTPVKTGTSPNVNIGLRNINDNFGFVWEGYINIQATGQYTFEIVSDDGSKLYFNSFYSPSATPLISHDGVHWAYGVSQTITVNESGLHPFALAYFDKTGGETMQVYITGPGIPRQLIPDMAFNENAGTPTPVIESSALAGRYLTAEASAETIVLKDIQAYPNPISDWINVAFFNSSPKTDVNANVYDMNGKLVYNQYYGNMPVGNNTLKMNIKGSKLAPGVYFVRLDINGVPSKTLKLVKPTK